MTVPTLSELRSWNADALRSAGVALDDAATAVESAVRSATASVDGLDAGGGWRGVAQDAASRRVAREADEAHRLVLACERAADAARSGAGAIGAARERVLAAVAAATGAGLVVDDQFFVTPGPASAVVSDVLVTAAAAQISGALTELAAADAAHAETLGSIAAELAAAGGGSAQPGSPGIPGPPDRPRTDPGAGPFGSQPWYARGDDLAFEQVARAAAAAADALGQTNAAAHLRHYLDGSGDPLVIDADQLLRDSTAARDATDRLVNEQVDRIAQEAAATGSYGQPVPFRSGWNGTYVVPEDSKDWFYAMGGIQQSVSGVVTVNPPTVPGGEPTVSVQYRTDVFDRYNWDGSKSTEIAGRTITDEQMGALQTAGLAREYDITGSSDVYTYDGPAAAPGQGLPLPQAPDNRDGTRTDPGR